MARLEIRLRTLGTTAASITYCGESRQVNCSRRGDWSTISLNHDADRLFAAVVEQFVKQPAPFLMTGPAAMDGRETVIVASVGGRVRLGRVRNCRMPGETRAALRTMVEIAAAMPATQRAVLVETARAIADPGDVLDEARSDEGLLEEAYITIPNDEPEQLLDVLLGKSRAPLSERQLVQSLFNLATLPGTCLGDRIWTTYHKQMQQADNARREIVWASIVAGSTMGLREYGVRVREDEGPVQPGRVLDEAIREIIADSDLVRLIEKASLRRLDARTAPALWNWMADHSTQLVFDPVSRRYRVR